MARPLFFGLIGDQNMKGDKSFGLRLFRLIVLVHIIFTAISLSVSAQDFSAVTIKDEIDLSVIEVIGDYDANTQEGNEAQKIIAGEFYNTHPDDYDFLVIFTGFDIEMLTLMIDGEPVEADGFYSPIQNNAEGIGNEIFDYSLQYGSNGKLQGIITMGDIDQKIADPLDPKFKNTMEVLSHELLHRWSGKVNFFDTNGSYNDALLGGYQIASNEYAHWSFLLDTDGSILYGNDWYDNGNGTFTSMAARKYYSPLDLYLMGFVDKSDVPPMLLIENASESREKLPMTGVTIEGDARYVSIDDIIAAEGKRVPGHQSSQKQFKIGIMLLTRPGSFQESEVHDVQTVIKQWTMWFSALTDGRAIVYYDGIGEIDLPENPGTELPPVDPRDVPAEIEDGVSWLVANQKEDGNWKDDNSSSVRDTAAAIYALNDFTIAIQNVSSGVAWMDSASTASLDHLSKKTAVMGIAGSDTSLLVSEIVEKQNPDGGWGSERFYLSGSLDTAVALECLAAAGYAENAVIQPAMAYLRDRQNINGGWDMDDGVSSIQTTTAVLSAFSNYLNVIDVEEQVQEGLAWLRNRQNGDGGFGNESSSVYETAEALIVLKKYDASFNIANSALDYIKAHQSQNGSWHESAHQTALSVSAMYAAMRETDLYISTGDISVIPESITQLPVDLQVNATIRNLGLTEVEQVTVALYDGGVAEERKVSEQMVSVGGNSFVDLTFTVTVTDGNPHLLYIAVDPEGLLTEAGTLNNTALKIVYPEGTKDLEILESDLTVSPAIADMLDPVSITATVRNNGTSDAFAVPLKFSVETAGESYLIAATNMDIPAGGSVSHELIWDADRSGDDLLISVQADPNNTISELSETNNKASLPIVVHPSTKANLTLSYQDIAFSSDPADEGGRGSVDISVVIRNNCASAAENFRVLFYGGIPDLGGEVIGTQTVAFLGAGESITVVNQWAPIDYIR